MPYRFNCRTKLIVADALSEQIILGLKSAPIAMALLLLLTFIFTPSAIASHTSNLIVDGSGESGVCSNDVDIVTTVPGWTVIKGSPNILCSSVGNYAVPKGHARGVAFLSGGPYGDSILKQSVDVSSAHIAIDSGRVTFAFAGWFGGKNSNPGQASVTLRFIGASGQSLGKPVTTRPVTAETRGNTSKFDERKVIGAVPVGTRTVAVILEFLDTEIDHAGTRKATAINTGCADNLSLRLSVPVNTPVVMPPASTVPPFDHVFLIMMENTTYSDLMANLQDAPFLKSVMARGAQFTDMTGIDHPSDQNYLAIAGGAAFVKGEMYFPNIRVNAKNIGDSLDAIGKTWKGYAQGMGVPCGLTNQYDKYYDADDLPFINFTDIRDNRKRCIAHLVDTSELSIDLKSAETTPNLAWIAADDYYDGEQAYDQGGLKLSLQTQDRWLRATVSPILDSPAWKTQRSLLIITWDESYYPFSQNHIPTLMMASQGLVRAGYQNRNSANLYDIARTIEEALGIPALTANDRYARPLNDVFAEKRVGSQ
jgi:hypothetical protein